jgi:hypothetical protein
MKKRIAPPQRSCLLARFARILKPGAYGSPVAPPLHKGRASSGEACIARSWRDRLACLAWKRVQAAGSWPAAWVFVRQRIEPGRQAEACRLAED